MMVLNPRQNFRDQRSQRKSGCGCIAPILLIVVIVALIVFFSTRNTELCKPQRRVQGCPGVRHINTGITSYNVCPRDFYGNDGNITFDHQYPGVEGNQVQLQGDIIKYWPGLNPLFQSGYKLTRLEGYYNDPNIERTYKPDPIYLNGGDDNFYKTVHGLPSVTPVVEAIPTTNLRVRR